MRAAHKALITCSPGLEEALQAELRALKVRRTAYVEPGVIAAQMSSLQLYTSNAFLRCATRILVNACSFRATSFSQLERSFRTHAIPALEPFVPHGAPTSIRVHSRCSSLYHEGAIAKRVESWLQKAAQSPSSPGSSSGPDTPEQLLSVFIDHDRFTVRVDSSGNPLYARSWHVDEGVKMPMRQSVAAGILHATGWHEGCSATALVDPFCGSGTLPIEAALVHLGQPPHHIERSDAAAPGRTFALQRWPSFEPGTWGAVCGDARERERAAEARRARVPPIVAADRDAMALAAAHKQARRAGVADLIEFREARLSDIAAPAAQRDAQGGDSGVLVTNPPWGIRSAGGGNLRSLYASLGTLHRERFSGWALGVLLEDRRLARDIAPGMHTTLRLRSGALKTYLMTIGASTSSTQTLDK